MQVTYSGLLAGQRGKVAALESAMQSMPQVDLPTDHTFGPHFYARTIHIPKGVTIVGKLHATEHVFILSKGSMTLVTDEGKRFIRAPFQVVSQPGAKRAAYAHEDCICTNVHINPTNETDLDKLEAAYITPEALPAPSQKEELPCPGQQ